MAEAPQATGAFVGEREELGRRVEELEAEVSRYREKEQLLVNTLVSATSHATAMRESARREAELILRKARAEARKRKAAVERTRGDAERELLRLRQITEQMRRGLSVFLTEKLEELQLEVGANAPTPEPKAELETALESAVDARLKGAAAPKSDQEAEILGEDERRSTGGSEHGLRSH
jgi:cell division septum initiation protein DivIVA